MRVIVIGNSGAGKTHHATELAAANDLAHLDLDAVAFIAEQAGVRRPLEDSVADVLAFCDANPRVAIEGCYGDIAAALDGTVEGLGLVWLDPGLDVCLAHCRARPWEPHKYPSKDAQDANLEMLLGWVASYETREDWGSRWGHQQVHDAWSGPKQHLVTPS